MKKMFCLGMIFLSLLTFSACLSSEDPGIDLELNNYMTEAIKEIKAYKDVSLYRSEEKVLLDAAIAIGIIDITAAKDKKSVDNAVSNTKTALDNIKTSAQITQEELENMALELSEYKVTIKKFLDDYISLDNYPQDDKSTLEGIISLCKATIDSANTKEQVDVAFATAKVEIGKIKSIDQLNIMRFI